MKFLPPPVSALRLPLAALALATLLSGCAVIAVADTAATVVVGAAGLAADAAIGAAKMVLPSGDKSDKSDKK